ncbi:hypothetical protein KVT40_007609 [Elsinoe batatas]|uniref:Life-span regulatory factor domain-containing protein n=1 Tax=Elsinoe batatas TaxID=2601811 RepID=A0A8K0PDF7_9PEZI|nr:hypothetical protein KVT40_007609 [Elsinoe batatas]
MTRPGTVRSNSYGRGHLKNTRPSTLKFSKGTHKSPPGSSKSIKRDSKADIEEDDWREMAGLPNYCTTCEKQIITPNASLLYCSEACRKKDGSRPLSACLDAGFPSPSPTTTFDPSSTYADIVPQRSPTVLRPPSIASDDGSIFNRPGMSRADSEASKYLSQFLSTSSGSPARRTPRSGYYRGQNTSSHSTLPSLSHTPNSMASPSSSYNSVSRTAPNRPVYWNGQRHHSTRSIDLVMPVTAPASVHKAEGQASLRSHASTATAFRCVEGELTYEKKPMAETSRQGSGSLKQLFAHEAMRRAPDLRYNYSNSSLSKHQNPGDD